MGYQKEPVLLGEGFEMEQFGCEKPEERGVFLQ